MHQEEEKEVKNLSNLSNEENKELELLGKKKKKEIENQENKKDLFKTNIHGIIFKKSNSEKTIKKLTCNCKNSQCLKLYCECFSKMAFCDPEFCSCKGCANTQENEVIILVQLINLNFQNYKNKKTN